jgi:Fe-S oxidoreductase
MIHNFHHHDNILGEKNFEKNGGNIAFFMGCLTKRELKDSVIGLFDKLGVDISILGGCCGYPIKKIGRTVTSPITQKIENQDISKLIVSCPYGMLALKEYNPIFITDYILSLNLKFKHTGLNYIYHDPSFLGRYLNIYNEPRQLINHIGTLLEYQCNRNMAQWCGGDIEFQRVFKREANELAEILVKEAQKKKATIITASPHCYHHLKHFGDVKDIVQLLEETVL